MITNPAKLLALGLIGITILSLSACQQSSGQAQGEVSRASDKVEATLETRCEDPRPQFCTREYRPVCGLRDTVVRCVTEPCPAAEWKTYGNACDACGDEKVLGYRMGACEAEGLQR